MKGRLRRLVPWLVGTAFLAFLFLRVPWDEFRRALAAGPYLEMALFVAFQVTVTLLADGWATAVSLAVVGVRRPAREVLLVRGATYLLGQINYALGQGGVGFYLHRTGVAGRRATGIVLFMLSLNGAALVLLAVAVWPLARSGVAAPPALLVGVIALVVALGGVVLAGRGRWRGSPLVEPWLRAGPSGVLKAFAARLVHAAALVVGLWATLRIWGIPVPLIEGLLRMPLVLLVAALPISPSGLGTTQTAQVLLFSAYVPAASAAARESTVLAASLAYHVLGVASQILLATWCWSRLKSSSFSRE